MKRGVATGWLERLAEPFLKGAGRRPPVVSDTRVPVFLKSSGAFRLPPSPTTPLVMIGPRYAACCLKISCLQGVLGMASAGL